MGKSVTAKRGKFWRTDWFVAVLIVTGVLIFNQTTDVVGTLERRLNDYASTQSSRQPSDRIANIGRWPRPRDVNTQLIPTGPAARRPLEAGGVRAPMPPLVEPGYDASRKTKARELDAFAKSDLIRGPDGAGFPPAGNGNTEGKAQAG